jgi:hypothetical protein
MMNQYHCSNKASASPYCEYPLQSNGPVVQQQLHGVDTSTQSFLRNGSAVQQGLPDVDTITQFFLRTASSSSRANINFHPPHNP